MKVGGDRLGDGRHPDDDLVVMLSGTRLEVVSPIFDDVSYGSQFLTNVLGFSV